MSAEIVDVLTGPCSRGSHQRCEKETVGTAYGDDRIYVCNCQCHEEDSMPIKPLDTA